MEGRGIQVVNLSSDEEEDWSWLEEVAPTGRIRDTGNNKDIKSDIAGIVSNEEESMGGLASSLNRALNYFKEAEIVDGPGEVGGGAELKSIGIMPTLDDTRCSFCEAPLIAGQGVVLEQCLHPFCKECVISAIEVTEDSPKTRCLLADDNDKCAGVLLDREVKALLSHDAYEKYLKRSLDSAVKEMKDFVSCGCCSALFTLTSNNDGKVVSHFNCAQCGKINCLLCGCSKDEGGLCACNKGSDGQPLSKVARIDPTTQREWEEQWKQAEGTIQKQRMNSSSGYVEECLFEMEKYPLLLNTREFECSICYSEVPPGQGVVLKECFHMFCRECLVNTVKHCEEAYVKCPHQFNENSCNSYITDREIKAFMPNEEHEKFLKRSVTQAEMSMKNSFHCKNVNCAGWCEIEGEIEVFRCQVCGKTNCVKCRAIHEAVSCLVYKQQLHEDEMDLKTKQEIMRDIKAGKAMKCPTCKVIIEKTTGCDAIICKLCKTEICWATKGNITLRL